MPKPPPFVSEAALNRWQIDRAGGLDWKLRRRGFGGLPFVGPYRREWRRHLTFEQMADLAMYVRDLGVAFSYGRDWAPSQVVLDLRDRGLFQGEFVEIAWGRDGTWRLATL